ncbi:hypothetical protein GDO86_013008 [Hymenochirus boettgeri]|uniref:Uncharacterized protein n=1 Tax=Hymenochirus boettgeri TaxID=247094 RepID=A0A8T2IT43_9PIPI|nr:hypothetical protein GDO86_013008 [Hymenochirus boettgeri]
MVLCLSSITCRFIIFSEILKKTSSHWYDGLKRCHGIDDGERLQMERFYNLNWFLIHPLAWQPETKAVLCWHKLFNKPADVLTATLTNYFAITIVL